MYSFVNDQRLGITIPTFDVKWDDLSRADQESIIIKWEIYREAIPDRIKELEGLIQQKYSQLNKENDFLKSCRLNTEISDMASIINDLHIWYRIDQHLSVEKLHS